MLDVSTLEPLSGNSTTSGVTFFISPFICNCFHPQRGGILLTAWAIVDEV